ncbi:hypothetical protein E8E11_006657 [Didymella keratinophila]|nr:hypothetical protein E8E11_006657 [Didymella keratinophila]
MNMNYPTVQLPATDQSRTDAAQVVFFTHLANISKIVKNILKLSGVHEERSILLLEERESLRQQLDRWRDSLPNYLSIESERNDGDDSEASFLYDWRARQQSSLRIHYNLAIIILLRSSLHIQREIDPATANCLLMALHRRVCVNAARDMIKHIHRSFEIATGLRTWSYYCFYCLQATLVLLPQTADSMASDDLMCRRAVEVFEQIKLKASQRCAEVVRQYLRRRTISRQRRQKRNDKDQEAVNGDQAPPPAGPALALQHNGRTQPTSQMTTDPVRALDQTFASGQDGDANAGSVFSFDEGTASWPSISPTTLQNEMYGALYSIDPSDNFYLGYQPFLFGGGSLTNDVSANDSSDWPPFWNTM